VIGAEKTGDLSPTDIGSQVRSVSTELIMKSNVDLKVLVLGIGLGAAITLLIGAAAPPSPTIGRYQITATDRLGLLLDTSTGEVWHHWFNPNVSERKAAAFFQPKNGPKLEN
jgi:hypothetical protein